MRVFVRDSTSGVLIKLPSFMEEDSVLEAKGGGTATTYHHHSHDINITASCRVLPAGDTGAVSQSVLFRLAGGALDLHECYCR